MEMKVEGGDSVNPPAVTRREVDGRIGRGSVREEKGLVEKDQ